MAKTKPAAKPVQRPEKKFGPYPGGVSVAVWLNENQQAEGPRQYRSITIAPRRYRDSQTGEWKDSSSYRPTDLPVLIFALQKAMEYAFEVAAEKEEGNGPTPF